MQIEFLTSAHEIAARRAGLTAEEFYAAAGPVLKIRQMDEFAMWLAWQAGKHCGQARNAVEHGIKDIAAQEAQLAQSLFTAATHVLSCAHNSDG